MQFATNTASPIRGVLADRQDLLLFAGALLLFLFDTTSTSYWAATSQEALGSYDRPFGAEQALAAFGFEALYLLFNLPSLWRGLRTNSLPVLLVLYVSASALWSYDPRLSLSASVNLGVAVCFALTAVQRHGTQAIGQRAFIVLTGLVMLNMASVLVPSLSFMTGVHDGAFRGLTNHKNSLGPVFVTHIVLILGQLAHPDLSSRTRVLLRWLLPVELAFLVLTRSSTGLATMAVVLAVYFGVRLMRRLALDLRIVVVVLLLVGAACVSLFISADDVFGLIGRDASLTGRSEIWDLALRFAADRPWFGWGYKAFPLVDFLTNVPRDDGGQRFIVYSTHSSYIELYCDLGIVGCALYVIFVAGTLRSAFANLRGPLLATALLTALNYLTAGLTESFSGTFAGLTLMTFLISNASQRQASGASSRFKTAARPTFSRQHTVSDRLS